MEIRGSYYQGESLAVELTPKKAKGKKTIRKIEQKIRSLLPLLNEFVTVDVDVFGKTGKLDYFQTSRSRAYERSQEKRYLYRVEIGIEGTEGKRKGIRQYFKEYLSCEEVVRLFYEICVDRVYPNLEEWDKTDRFFSPQRTAAETRGKRKIERYKNAFWTSVEDKCDQSLRDAVLWETLETLCYEKFFTYSTFFIPYCFEFDSYLALERLINDRAHDALLAEAKGDLLYQGKTGAPDLKAAYEYYVHAARTGSFHAAWMVARSYRDGWFAPPDPARYEEIVRGIFDCYIQYKPGHLFAVPEVVLALSEIEEAHGNTEKAIEYCLEWKNMALSCFSDSCYPSENDEKIILQLYRLTEFDPEEIDLLDLFYVLRSPCRVRIALNGGATIAAEAVRYEDEVIVKCGNQYFRTVCDFFSDYRYKKERITAYTKKIQYIIKEEDL